MVVKEKNEVSFLISTLYVRDKIFFIINYFWGDNGNESTLAIYYPNLQTFTAARSCGQYKNIRNH